MWPLRSEEHFNAEVAEVAEDTSATRTESLLEGCVRWSLRWRLGSVRNAVLRVLCELCGKFAVPLYPALHSRMQASAAGLFAESSGDEIAKRP
jgi:hypothetical protein